VKDDAIFFLEDRLVEAYERMSHEPSEDTLEIQADAEITIDEVNETLLRKLERLAPFGVGNPKPLFLVRNVAAQKISRFGKGNEHIKIEFASTQGTSVAGITFFAKGDIARIADACAQGDRVSFLAHIERDTFSRGNPIRLRIIALRAV
jgi:single-stranded-DNA-specific exonuclease